MTLLQKIRARTAVGYGDNSTVIRVETPERLGNLKSQTNASGLRLIRN